MSKSITQDMAYRQSLMKYAEKYGVSRASRKYNKGRSYIYFWKARWDGSAESLACQSRRPHSHPNQHTEAELKQIRDMRRRNPDLGLIELWHRLKQIGYTRRPESLFRVMRKLGMFPQEKKKKTYTPKPYEQMTYPGQRVQVDVKVVPRRCIADPELRLFQYTAIDEFTRLRFLAAYPEQSTYSSADFLKKLVKWYARRGIRVECVQTDNGFAVIRNHLERRITGFAANRQHTSVQGLDFRGRGFFREHERHHHHQSNNHTQQLLHCYHPPENRFFTILLSAGALPGNSA